MNRRAFAALLAALLALAGMSCAVAEAIGHDQYESVSLRDPAGGTVGDNIIWKWDEESLTLTVTGEGAMPAFDNDGGAPWSCLRMKAQTVVIGEGITNIGDLAFTSFESMTSLIIPSTVERIGVQAFEGCSALGAVTIPADLYALDYGAFQCCQSLETAVFLGGPPAEAGENIFRDCDEDFRICYYPGFAGCWAPNGETTWHGYPIAPYGYSPEPQPGDINGDGELGFTDVSALYGFLVGGGYMDVTVATGDINGDSELTFADISALYEIMIGA